MPHLSNDKNPKNADFKPAGLPTLIGSLPVASHEEALHMIFEHTPDIPLWPQLPSNRLEGMLNQFIEGFPGVVETDERTYFNINADGFAEEQLAFFEQYLEAAEDPEKLSSSVFKISRKRAQGLYGLYDAVKEKQAAVAVKGQITGPFTMLTGISDQDRRLGYYDPTIREMVVKGLALKASWQVHFLNKLGLPVLLFIDEPALAGLGSSSFISISLDDIRQDLSEVIAAVQGAGGLAGIHVCANTDWDFLLSLDLDILSFDAYGFFDRLLVSKDKVHSFLARGGIIAWGIVPTSEKEHILRENADSLASLWEKQAAQLSSENWDMTALLNQTLITPSCGTGSLSPDLARRVLTLTRDVSAILRKKYL